MFISFSKNLGNGFRIGIGHNFNNNYKPSKRDSNREEFILKVRNEIRNLIREMCNRLNVSQDTFEFAVEQSCQIEISDILTESNCKKISEISDIFSNIYELIEKVCFSKNLSTQTKEKITDLIFESKKIILTLESENDLEQRLIFLLSKKLQKKENQIKKLIKKHNKKTKEKIKKTGCLTYIIAFFIFMLIISFINHEDKPNEQKNISVNQKSK
ncbi:hypothetical protein OJP00_08280 [Campylobacter lari]|uniref:hypothetical protein n=1 Tax=Campylobacter lari TaxID=201 RepID=UPI0021F7DD40|nr:hypothetical protein [Campylobacter lari]MCW0186545.1 hypothetical protein [Campylobacter lari]